MITYYKLFDLLNRRNMKKTDLLKIISAPTLSKLSNNETVNTKTIDKICLYLGVQPNSIMEIYQIINKKKVKLNMEQFATLYDNDYEDFTLTDEEKNRIIEECLEKKEDYYIINEEQYMKKFYEEIEKTKKQ